MAFYAKKSSVIDFYSYFIEPIIDFITICVSVVRSILHINIVVQLLAVQLFAKKPDCIFLNLTISPSLHIDHYSSNINVDNRQNQLVTVFITSLSSSAASLRHFLGKMWRWNLSLKNFYNSNCLLSSTYSIFGHNNITYLKSKGTNSTPAPS